MVKKQTIIDALNAWVSQRPGLDYGNYGDPVAYRAEVRSIGKDLQHARAMINYVAWHDSITAEMILDAADNGGRLSIKVVPCHSVNQQSIYQARRATGGILEMPPADSWRITIDYCTGQYWPTEYRPAVCRLLSSVIWHWMRENAPVDAGPIIAHSNLQDVGGYIRKTAKRELGTSIARRWFA